MGKHKDEKIPVNKTRDSKLSDHRERLRFTDEKRKNKEAKDQTVGGF